MLFRSEKKVAEMRQELHPDALVEDAYRAILGAMNGAYCDGLQGKGAPGDLAAAISDAERSLGEFAGVVQGRIDKVVRLRHQAYEQGRRDAVRLGAEEGQSMTSEEKYPNFARLTALLNQQKCPRKTLDSMAVFLAGSRKGVRA